MSGKEPKVCRVVVAHFGYFTVTTQSVVEHRHTLGPYHHTLGSSAECPTVIWIRSTVKCATKHQSIIYVVVYISCKSKCIVLQFLQYIRLVCLPSIMLIQVMFHLGYCPRCFEHGHG